MFMHLMLPQLIRKYIRIRQSDSEGSAEAKSAWEKCFIEQF